MNISRGRGRWGQSRGEMGHRFTALVVFFQNVYNLKMEVDMIRCIYRSNQCNVGSYLLLVLCVEDCRVPVLVRVLDPRVKLYEGVDQVRVTRAGRQHQGGHQVMGSETGALYFCLRLRTYLMLTRAPFLRRMLTLSRSFSATARCRAD